MHNTVWDEKKLSLTNEIFLQEMWNYFYDCLEKKENVILNLQKYDFIEDTVVTKLCCLGAIGKKNGIDVEIIPSLEILDYLANMDFWNTISKYNILKFDDRYTVYTPKVKKVTNAFLCLEKSDIIEKYENKFEFQQWVSTSTKCKWFIKAELVGIENLFNSIYSLRYLSNKNEAILKIISEFTGGTLYDSGERIVSAIVEIVHNAVWHSDGLCFLLVQACTYQNKHVGIEVSVADTGIGLYKSLLRKGNELETKCFKQDEFKKIKDTLTQNYCAIVEALLFRKKSVTRGLYDIMSDLKNGPYKKDTGINIINGNMSLNIKKEEITRFLDGDIDFLFKDKNKYMKQKKDIGYSYSIDVYIEK